MGDALQDRARDALPPVAELQRRFSALRGEIDAAADPDVDAKRPPLPSPPSEAKPPETPKLPEAPKPPEAPKKKPRGRAKRAFLKLFSRAKTDPPPPRSSVRRRKLRAIGTASNPIEFVGQTFKGCRIDASAALATRWRSCRFEKCSLSFTGTWSFVECTFAQGAPTKYLEPPGSVHNPLVFEDARFYRVDFDASAAYYKFVNCTFAKCRRFGDRILSDERPVHARRTKPTTPYYTVRDSEGTLYRGIARFA